MTCRPHHWRTPKVGDAALECEACGRRLDFAKDITPNIRASIVVGYERRTGNADGFRAAFNAAYDAAVAAYIPPDRPAAVRAPSGNPLRAAGPGGLPKRRRRGASR